MKTAAIIINWVMVILEFLGGLIALIITGSYTSSYGAAHRMLIFYWVIFVFSMVIIIAMNAVMTSCANKGKYVAAGTLSFFFGFLLSTLYFFLIPVYEGKAVAHAQGSSTRYVRPVEVNPNIEVGEAYFLRKDIYLGNERIKKGTAVVINDINVHGDIIAGWKDQQGIRHQVRIYESDIEIPKKH